MKLIATWLTRTLFALAALILIFGTQPPVAMAAIVTAGMCYVTRMLVLESRRRMEHADELTKRLEMLALKVELDDA
jgi:hypothetical protein